MKPALAALILSLLTGALGCWVAGIGIVFGAGWALISAAPCLAGLAFLFANGTKRDG